MSYVCFDIGGTNLKMGVSLNGEINNYVSVKTPKNYDEMLKLMSLYVLENPCKAVGIGIPGNVNGGSAYCPNLSVLNGKPLAADLFSETGIPVYVENDANLAALGEYTYFEEKSPHNMILITLGTGVGGGLIVNGQLVGSDTAAFEVGHITIDVNGSKCSCGKRGCFEYYCSTGGLVRSFNDLNPDMNLINAGDVYKLYKEGNKLASLAFEQFGNNLAHGLASLTNLFAPLHIRIGGRLSEMSDAYMSVTLKVFSKIVFPSLRDKAVINIAESRNMAGLLGAAALCDQKNN